MFGQDCLQPCPQACTDICNKITGHCECGNLTNVSPRCESCPPNCDSGCQEDLECMSCKVPFYGDQCTKVCPPNCRMNGLLSRWRVCCMRDWLLWHKLNRNVHPVV